MQSILAEVNLAKDLLLVNSKRHFLQKAHWPVSRASLLHRYVTHHVICGIESKAKCYGLGEEITAYEDSQKIQLRNFKVSTLSIVHFL